jgi:putative ABC transport system permease protein
MRNTNIPWFWFILMAWRDSRGSRHRLFLAAAALTIGIAALVAVSSFRSNVQEAVDQQAKSLLGADIAISNQQPFSPEVESIITALGGEQARELSCSSMIVFPKSGGTRLAQIRAVAGNFPFYGVLETVPPEAGQTFRSGFQTLVDDNLLFQFDAQVGDSIKIGEATFEIVGRLKKIPGEAMAAALIGPRIYIPMAALESTALLQKGSRVTYKTYLRLPSGVDPDQRLAPFQEQLNTLRVDHETVTKRAARVGKVMTNLSRFLSLVGFVALLLGGIGVASAMHAHGQEKRNTVALLHCLGANPRQTLAIYFLQTLGLGLVGGILGIILGLTVHALLPLLLRDFLPIQITLAVSWWAVIHGLLAGVILAPLFALIPLLAVRRISPLGALRVAHEQEDAQPIIRDPLRLLMLAFLVLYVAGFAIMQTAQWTYALTFCAAVGVAFGLLIAIGKSVMVLARTYIPASWPYPWRQGLANLFRPHNQTLVLILTLGAGTFFLVTLFLVQQSLLQQITHINETNQPNLVLFDIQSDQREAVANLVHASQLPVLQDLPLVTMRLAAVKGKKVADLRNDEEKPIPDWALQWEYRSTYRQHLLDSETVVAGRWHDTVVSAFTRIPISLEEELAQTLKVTLGDELVFDVQGILLTTTVQSLRKVDWNRIQPNFFVVFPVGVLETAPQTYVLLTKALTNEKAATLQRTAVQRFPNISAIDLTVILNTLDAILARVMFVLRFMGLFTVAAGVIVLVGAVRTTYVQRIRESALLRTLGASRRQLRRILLIEYFFLGSFAAVTGVLLALIGSWALTRFLFEVTFTSDVWSLVLTPLLIISLTMIIGVVGNRKVTTHPPLEVLREEG